MVVFGPVPPAAVKLGQALLEVHLHWKSKRETTCNATAAKHSPHTGKQTALLLLSQPAHAASAAAGFRLKPARVAERVENSFLAAPSVHDDIRYGAIIFRDFDPSDDGLAHWFFAVFSDHAPVRSFKCLGAHLDPGSLDFARGGHLV